jgi:hypothetical protein
VTTSPPGGRRKGPIAAIRLPHDRFGHCFGRKDLTIYSYRIITKRSCPRGVLPEASWSGAGSAPAAGADACSGLGRPKANSGGNSHPSEIRAPRTTTGPCHGIARGQSLCPRPCGRPSDRNRRVGRRDTGILKLKSRRPGVPLPSPSALQEPGANLSTNNSGRKDRESDAACDYSRYVFRVIGPVVIPSRTRWARPQTSSAPTRSSV